VGVTTALLFAMPLWCASHIGAFADQVRGDPTSVSQAAAVQTTPTGDLLVLAASLLWLADGHWFVALRTLLHDDALVAPPALVAAMAKILQSSLSLTMLVAVPMLAFEVAVLSIARIAAPISVANVVTPLRPLAVIWLVLRAAPIALGAVR
jgi:type III secretory pathway component EscT